MYIARQVHSITGAIQRYFGSLVQCEKHIETIGREYVYEIRPANRLELRSEIGVLVERRCRVEFNHGFATPDKVARYQQSLDRIDRQLVRLREALAKLESANENTRGADTTTTANTRSTLRVA